jgi:chromosome segregation ATPase
LLIVAGVFYMRDRKGRDQLLVARTEITNLTNRIAEARAKLEQEENLNRTLDSNVLTQARQTAALTSRVDRITAALEKAERSLAAAQAQAAEREQQLATANTEIARSRDELERTKNDLSARERDAAQLTEKLAVVEQQRENLVQDVQKAQVQNTQLLLQLNDPMLLRAQQSKLRKQYLSVLYAAPNGHATENQAAGGEGAAPRGSEQIVQKPRPPGGKGRIQLEPDGSVRVIPQN